MKKTLNTDCASCGIRSLTILKSAGAELLKLMSAKKSCMKFQRGITIVKEGDKTSGIYIVSSGVVKFHKTGIHGKQSIIRLASTGAIIGLSAEPNSNNDYSVTTVEDASVCFIELDDFNQALKSHSELKDELLNVYKRELKEIEMRILNLGQLSVREKVAEALLYIARIYNLKNGTGFTRINLSRNDIAEMTGAASVHVSKVYCEFKKENILQASGRLLNILDMAKLEAIYPYYKEHNLSKTEHIPQLN